MSERSDELTGVGMRNGGREEVVEDTVEVSRDTGESSMVIGSQNGEPADVVKMSGRPNSRRTHVSWTVGRLQTA